MSSSVTGECSGRSSTRAKLAGPPVSLARPFLAFFGLRAGSGCSTSRLSSSSSS